jgi:Na+-driven multidrug efflux pump
LSPSQYWASKLKKYAVVFIPIGVTLSILLYFGLPNILKIVLPDYHTTGFLLIMNILLVLLPFKVWGAVISQGFIVPAGFAKITTITTLIGGVLNVILDYVFISILGFIGVFWVTLVIHSLNILTITAYFYLKIKSLEN